jgi:hypothetical protein
MENEQLPPKTVKAQLVRLDDNLKRIERTQFAGIQRAPGSLPVLEAFQLFLEKERKAAQRRLWIVTVLCMLAILATVTGAAIYIRYTLRHADTRTDALARTTAQIESSVDALSQRQQLADQRLEQAAQALADQQAAVVMHAEMLDQQRQAAVAIQEDRASEVIRLREQMEALLADQESIRRMLAGTQQTAIRPSRVRTQPRQEPIGPVQQTTARTPAPIEYAVINVPSEGRTAVRWMLPIVNVPE